MEKQDSPRVVYVPSCEIRFFEFMLKKDLSRWAYESGREVRGVLISLLLSQIRSFFALALLLCLSVEVAAEAEDPYPANDPRYIWQHIEPYNAQEDTSEVIARFPKDFLFGIATASSHLEEDLEDSWLVFAKQGGVRAYEDVPYADERLNFFSDPEAEIVLAQQAGARIFRLSLNWNRLVPDRPEECTESPCLPHIQNREALERYGEILRLIKSHGMKTMITLFHHDLPLWSIPHWREDDATHLGWLDPAMPGIFAAFVEDLVSELGDDIDYILSFNEPTLHSFLTHVVHHWPPGQSPDLSQGLPLSFDVLFGYKDFATAMNQIVEAHKRAYRVIKKHQPDLPVGVAHVTPYLEERGGWLGAALSYLHKSVVVNFFPDAVLHHIDFLGVNYYGQEDGSVFDFSLRKPLRSMYSDAGRQLNAGGLYSVLRDFYQRYHKRRPDLEYFITENGVADNTDLVRMPFLLEHLRAAAYAIEQGIPLKGYLFWTTSDNWEWADGYCPKFGLFHVDRLHSFKRTPKPSFYLFRAVSTQGLIRRDMLHYAHSAVDRMLDLRRDHATFARRWDGKRGFCRSQDGFSGKDKPERLPFAPHKGWVFEP